MQTGEAARLVASEARRFADGNADIVAFWYSFMGVLSDLCENEPLSGDHLEMFFALEAWEEAVGSERTAAVNLAREIARRLAADH